MLVTSFRKWGYCTHMLFIGRKAKSMPEFVVPLQGYYTKYYNDWKTAQAHPESDQLVSHYMLDNMPGFVRAFFPILAPIYRALPIFLRTPIVDGLIYLKNRRELRRRERIRC